jgi:hypothetical protein
MIVIPMAGLSRRFTEAGYKVPKYMLEAHGRTLFDYAVLSFAEYFESVPFLFIARDIADTPAFIRARCEALGIKDFHCVALQRETRGQAETVALGLQAAGIKADTPITIFNIDTFRPGFRFPDFMDTSDGYLETFVGEGEAWSFVQPIAEGTDQVAETTEKRRISHFCCTGLYHFGRASAFLEAYGHDEKLSKEELQAGELYVAPLYNRLIAKGADIRFSIVPAEAVVFSGVPAEYHELLRHPDLLPY